MKHGYWTIIFEDKTIIKKTGEFTPTKPAAYVIEDGVNWDDAKWNNIHAIQFTDDGVDNDQVEYKDTSPNGVYDAAVLGDFRSQFINAFDAAHLAKLQEDWDNDQLPFPDDLGPDDPLPPEETEAEKTARLGPRPTSYTS
tara:strand:- start:954 stop:1373 length:420 start_codon:yes stop_codon:yes gene_type:complete